MSIVRSLKSVYLFVFLQIILSSVSYAFLDTSDDSSAASVTSRPSNQKKQTSSSPIEESQEQLESPLQKYVLGERLGSGGQACVYTVANTLRPLAIKVYQGTSFAQQSRSREANILAILQSCSAPHPNIIQMLGDREDFDSAGHLILELALGSSLTDLINERHLSPTLALNVLKQSLIALEHMHRHGVAHNDLKPCNLLLAQKVVAYDPAEIHIKIADFGSAFYDVTHNQNRLASPIVITAEKRLLMTGDKRFSTYNYKAPRKPLAQHFTEFAKDDVWSLGLTVLKIFDPVLAQKYDMGTSSDNIYHAIYQRDLRLPSLWQDQINIIEQLENNPKKDKENEILLRTIIKDMMTADRDERPSAERTLRMIIQE